jgi:hypothetical protein
MILSLAVFSFFSFLCVAPLSQSSTLAAENKEGEEHGKEWLRSFRTSFDSKIQDEIVGESLSPSRAYSSSLSSLYKADHRSLASSEGRSWSSSTPPFFYFERFVKEI